MRYQIVFPTSLDYFDQEWRDALRAEIGASGPPIDHVIGPLEVVFLSDGEIRQDVVAQTTDDPTSAIFCRELIEKYLSPLSQKIIIMLYFDNLSVTEVARQTNLSEKKVRRMENLALRAMREGQRIV